MNLTATENVRICNFSHRFGLDDVTAEAMFNLFGITKGGKNDIASALITASYETGTQLCESAIAYLKPLGLVRDNGSIAKNIRNAIIKAVEEKFLIIDNGPNNPFLKPTPDFLEPRYE